MRGNELAPRQEQATELFRFPIPMRGNEERHPSDVVRLRKVSDPHEG